MEAKYTIKVISDSCGILPHTLRVWEQRYGVFDPERSDGGQRLYRDEDLKKAKLLAYLIGQGHTISKLAGYSVTELEEMKEVFKGDRPEAQKSEKGRHYTRSLIAHVNKYNLRGMTEELQFMRLSMSAKDFIFKVVLPFLREIGLLVAQGELTVTQEHIVSTLLRDQLSQINLPNIGIKSKEMAFATPEGNQHELSIVIGEILCRSCRVPTRYLGPAHPADCLAEAMNAMKSPSLVLGVVTSDSWDYDKEIEPFLLELDSKLKYSLDIYLGGGLEKSFPKFKKINKVHLLATFEELESLLTQGL
jgi:DNA-binding transcriptional MerR regulator